MTIYLSLGFATCIYSLYFERVKNKLDPIIYRDSYLKHLEETNGVNKIQYIEKILLAIVTSVVALIFWPIVLPFIFMFHIDRINDYREVMKTGKSKYPPSIQKLPDW